MCRKSFSPVFAWPLTEEEGEEVAEEVWHEILPRIARDDTNTLVNRADRERRLLGKAEQDEESETLFDGNVD